MGFSIRKINADDYDALILLFTEFAAFEKVPEKMTNSVEKMWAEQAYFNGFITMDESGEIVGYVTFFLLILPGLANP